MSESKNKATENNNILGFLRQGVQKIGEFAKNRVMSVIGSPVASAEIPETNEPIVMGPHDTRIRKEKLGPPAPYDNKKSQPNLLARLNNFIVPPANAITAEEDAQQKRVLNTQGKTEESSQSPKQLHATMMKKTGINHKTFADVTEANNELTSNKDPDIFAKIAALKEANPNYEILYDGNGAVNIVGIQQDFTGQFTDKDKKEKAILNGSQLVTKQTITAIAANYSEIAAEVMSDALNGTESSTGGKGKVNYQAELEKALKQAMAVMPIAISSSRAEVEKLATWANENIASYAGDMIRQLSAPTIKAKEKIMEKDKMPTKEQITEARNEIAQQQEQKLDKLKETAREKNVPIIPEDLANDLKDAEKIKIQTAINNSDNPKKVVSAYLKIKNILEDDEVDQGELVSLVQIVTGNDEIQKLNDLASFPKLIKRAEAITNPYSDNPFSETVASMNQFTEQTKRSGVTRDFQGLESSLSTISESVESVIRNFDIPDTETNNLSGFLEYVISKIDAPPPTEEKVIAINQVEEENIAIDNLPDYLQKNNVRLKSTREAIIGFITKKDPNVDTISKSEIEKTRNSFSGLENQGLPALSLTNEDLENQYRKSLIALMPNHKENLEEMGQREIFALRESLFYHPDFSIEQHVKSGQKQDQIEDTSVSFDPSLLVQGIIDFAGDELEAGEQNASSALADNLSQDNLNFIDVTMPT
jgi:hypothetical protein